MNPNVILNRLYKHTQLQTSYSMIMLALVNGEPKILNLYQILDEYLKHQKEVVTRRTRFDLRKAEERARCPVPLPLLCVLILEPQPSLFAIA